MHTVAEEKVKYEKAWDLEGYRNYSPGEQMSMPFIFTVRPKMGSTIVDFGAGCGRASLAFHEIGYVVKMFDIAENCLDDDVKEAIGDKLTLGCLWSDALPTGNTGYCCDVLEHIPPEHIDATLHNIISSCEKSFFSICFVEDHAGKHIDEQLHLTVKPFEWWVEKLQEHGKLTLARDLLDAGAFLVEREQHNVQ